MQNNCIHNACTNTYTFTYWVTLTHTHTHPDRPVYLFTSGLYRRVGGRRSPLLSFFSCLYLFNFNIFNLTDAQTDYSSERWTFLWKTDASEGNKLKTFQYVKGQRLVDQSISRSKQYNCKYSSWFELLKCDDLLPFLQYCQFEFWAVGRIWRRRRVI